MGYVYIGVSTGTTLRSAEICAELGLAKETSLILRLNHGVDTSTGRSYMQLAPFFWGYI